MTPIEQAARALASTIYIRRIVDCDCPDAEPIERPIAWDALSEEARSIAMQGAHAVVEAIREPTDSMVEAGWDAGPDHAPSVYYAAMLAKVLERP